MFFFFFFLFFSSSIFCVLHCFFSGRLKDDFGFGLLVALLERSGKQAVEKHLAFLYCHQFTLNDKLAQTTAVHVVAATTAAAVLWFRDINGGPRFGLNQLQLRSEHRRLRLRQSKHRRPLWILEQDWRRFLRHHHRRSWVSVHWIMMVCRQQRRRRQSS